MDVAEYAKLISLFLGGCSASAFCLAAGAIWER